VRHAHGCTCEEESKNYRHTRKMCSLIMRATSHLFLDADLPRDEAANRHVVHTTGTAKHERA
jgi:hypothetical protein